MKSTPVHDDFNRELLAAIPKDSSRVVELGCSGGTLARVFLETAPRCEYIGIEIDPDLAALARRYCTKVLVGDIEQMPDHVFATLFPSDCWIFGDVLEHLYDPWSVLRRIRSNLAKDGSIVACIPNAQHWSLQAKLNNGEFIYEDGGLLDRTHIRWFTRITVSELFQTSGYEIVELSGRIFDEPGRTAVMPGIRALATATGCDPDTAEADAMPLQWVVRAVPV